MPEIRHILYVQHHDVLEKQRDEIERIIQSNLEVPVAFASSPEDIPQEAQHDVVIAPTLPWLADLLNRLPQLQWVHFLSAGVEKIWDMNFDWSNVKLSKSSGVHSAPMSEFALGAMLYFAKDFDRFIEQSRHRQWQRTWLGELTGQNLVIVGMGSVGSVLADRAVSFGMNVFGIASKQHKGQAHKIEPITELNEYLAIADYVVLTLPLTAHTRGLGNASFFNALKPGAVLVDISRGGIVQADSLVEALERGKLRGAALDVFEEEPLPQTSLLWNRADVLLTPHVAGTTPYYLSRALDSFVTNSRLYLNNEPLKTAVDQFAGY